MLGHNLSMCNETPLQNRDANFFANEFYCPSVLIVHFDLFTRSKMISNFGISAQYADVLLDKLVIKVKKDFSDNEKRLLNAFLKNRNGKK